MLKKNSAYKIGSLRDIYNDKEDEDIFTLTVKVSSLAKRIKESFDPSPQGMVTQAHSYGFEESKSSISSAIALSKAISELLAQEEESPKNRQ